MTRIVVVLALIFGGLVAVASPAAADAPWTIPPTPSPTGPSMVRLAAVACTSASNCFAVGSYSFGGLASGAVIEQWNGASWSVMATPDSPGSGSDSLSGITCPSSTNCFAVGETFSFDDEHGISSAKTLIEQWTGSDWSIVTSPSPHTSDRLIGVGCPTTTKCFAVGVNDTALPTKALVERWNGSTWAVVTGPAAPGSAELDDITCPKSTSCLAVGHKSGGFEGAAFAARWNGTGWSAVSVPAPSGASGSSLSGVSCPVAGNCFAVGRARTNVVKPLLEHWNGSGWHVASIPVPPAGTHFAELSDVTCPDTTRCIAVGSSGTGTVKKTLIELWNGSTWSVQSSPNPVGATSGELDAVTCETRAFCVALGGDELKGAAYALQGNGPHWALVHTKAPVGAQTRLSDVACPTATTCFAVGESSAGSKVKPLIERWDGADWTVVASPTLTNSAALTGITCLSTTRCLAVGGVSDATGMNLSTLAERWDGVGWSVVPSASLANSSNQLLKADCAAPGNCFAVGISASSSGIRPMIEHWNGTAWTVVSSPLTPNAFSFLEGIACESATSCFAVGFAFSFSGSSAVIEHWNGISWSLAAHPNPPGVDAADLASVRCPAVHSCIAVGDSIDGDVASTLALKWNGSAWSIVASPNAGASEGSVLTGVSCVSTTNCVAVGSSNDEGAISTLAELWNGATWTIDPTPNAPDSDDSELSAIDCAAAGDCTAVGSFLAGPESKTLVEHYVLP